MMRRLRSAAAVVVVAVLAAVSCTADDGGADRDHVIPSSATGDPSTGPTFTAGGDRRSGEPQPVGRALPPVTPTATMPFTWEDSTLVAAPWAQRPQVAGAYFVGFAAPGGDGAPLEYSVVDSYGTLRWTALRPAACTGFAVSTADGEPIVVLTDSDVVEGEARGSGADGDDGRWRTTASAYLLATGERVWGPVPVPGTVQGPGLVFGASAAGSVLGATGPRIALDPVSGAIVVDEATDPDVRVVGEYDGIVVTAAHGLLTALAAADGTTLWSAPAPVGGSVIAVPGRSAPPGGALVTTGPREPVTVIDLADGFVVFDDAIAAAHEPLTDTWLSLTADGLRAESTTHPPWQRDIPADATIALAATGLVYLRQGDAVHVINATTGDDAQAYPVDVDGPVAVPQDMSTLVAGLFLWDGQWVVATVEEPPGG